VAKEKKSISKATKRVANPGRSLDPACKKKPGITVPEPGISSSGKPMRMIGAALGVTVQVGDKKEYMRFDAWESRYVEDDPVLVEQAKRDLAADLRNEITLQHQEAEEELLDN